MSQKMRHVFLSNICFKRRCSFIFTKYQSAYNDDILNIDQGGKVWKIKQKTK